MQMKDLNALGETAWNRALAVLQVCGRIVVTGGIAYTAYAVVKSFDANELVAYIAAAIACLLMIAAYTSFSSVMTWVVIVATVLGIGFAVLTVIITPISPPSLYSLLVVGVVLLAGILYQLNKIANRP
jgi:hypothetical protein